MISKLKQMKFERWLERPFNAFVLSLFEDSSRKESFEKIGIPGVELRTQLFQNSSWYFNDDAFNAMDLQVETYLESHSMTDITRGLEDFKQKNKKRIATLLLSSKAPEEKFAEVFEMLNLACTYIWLAHGLEAYYKRMLNEEVTKYVKSDVEKFIGDASFPKKQNAHSRFEEAMRSGVSAEEISNTFGWIKTRDGFSDPFSPAEIEKMRKEIPVANEHVDIEVPNELKSLFEQIQELVFFRTERTDVLYELMFMSRPILVSLGEKHSLPFGDMRYYRAKSFIAGKAEKYNPNCSFAYLDGEVLFNNEPIIEEKSISGDEEVKGSIAFRGMAKGVVKIIKDASELDKVQPGDILVTQMTFPSFIPAMNRAAAFVTDEGGITCHAAIVARELHKPCIIGTKIATKVLHDGDVVEVDADKGIVRIIK